MRYPYSNFAYVLFGALYRLQIVPYEVKRVPLRDLYGLYSMYRGLVGVVCLSSALGLGFRVSCILRFTELRNREASNVFIRQKIPTRPRILHTLQTYTAFI